MRGAKGIKRHNALFHLFENASKSAQMDYEIFPPSTHASADRVRGAKGIKRYNALFHLFENASKSAQMYHEILSTSTHAHKYFT